MHELEQFTDGSTAFVAARTSAWHRLGTVLPDAFTAEEAMTYARLDAWDVDKAPVYAHMGGTDVVVPGKFVTTRANPVTGVRELIGGERAGIVGEVYEPFQNESLCSLLNAITDESGAVFDTAGSLRGGADAFVTMRLPDSMLVGGIDRVDVNIACLNNHTGAAAIRLLVTPTRIVCSNTQAAALRNAVSTFKIRHTATAAQRVQEAREALGLTWKYVAAFEAEAEKMVQGSLTDAAFDGIVNALWTPAEPDAPERVKRADADRYAALQHLFGEADTNAAIRGTAWAGYQAVTEYLDHLVPVRARGDKQLVRAERVATGAYDSLKHAAFDLFSRVAA